MVAACWGGRGGCEGRRPKRAAGVQVQSFMRGWLCRRRWKIIVQDYISSPHAESMRKRNQIVFNMVEAETEYVHQLSILVNCFLRPLRMAASSKKPPISHDDVSTVFLNRFLFYTRVCFLHPPHGHTENASPPPARPSCSCTRSSTRVSKLGSPTGPRWSWVSPAEPTTTARGAAPSSV